MDPIKTQRQATHDIIAKTDYNTAKSISEVDTLARQRSDELYNERQRRIKSFDPFSVEIASVPVKLTYPEMYFLKQMSRQPVENPTVYAYWVYEYSLDFCVVMAKLISGGYLRISNLKEDLQESTVDQLKDILSQNNLVHSGKKATLVERIFNEVADFTNITFKKTYQLTELGISVTKDLPKSATKDLEFESNCLSFILNKQLYEAYKLICENENGKIIPRGIGIDWKKETNNGLSEHDISSYSDFLDSELSDLAPELAPYETEVKCCCVFAVMLGMPSDKIALTFFRITGSSLPRNIVVTNIQKYIFALMEDKQYHSLKQLSASNSREDYNNFVSSNRAQPDDDKTQNQSYNSVKTESALQKKKASSVQFFKKFLGVLLCIGAFVFIVFTEQVDPNLQPLFILIVACCIFGAVLLFKKSKKQIKGNHTKPPKRGTETASRLNGKPLSDNDDACLVRFGTERAKSKANVVNRSLTKNIITKEKLNPKEHLFFDCLAKKLLDEGLKPGYIELDRLSSGTINVLYNRFYIGKIFIPEKDVIYKYRVIKDGNTRATRVFDSLALAEAYAKGKNQYRIEEQRTKISTWMQCLIGDYNSKVLEDIDIDRAIEAIPVWIRHIKHCVRTTSF